MNRLMNCDHVFDILTRAPFPAGEASDADVEHHLRACHECRQLAEALRPAVDLFHESIPSDESFDLPGYMGNLFSAADATVSTSVRTQSTTRREINSGMASSGLGMVICLLVCCGLMFSFGRDLMPALHSPAVTPGDGASRPDRTGLELLTSLELPSICREAFDTNRSVAQAGENGSDSPADPERWTQCCTECHAVANPQRPKLTSTVKLTSSCAACHKTEDPRNRHQAT
ncbi:MAG TPA: hypothetical protein QF564_28060 [Pirellulaceae bacterium]|jgi:hypothetical protein|nr:hypothetical protein [Pirellulaceae bacterium]